ncbi:aldo/keto reductase [Halorubrum vacuolatum]|uniref:2,5-diketo-D-gluconate reductase B n=1 Tax=Halorubrum vacuolatum TaxID=63740 RepID=A0A238VBE5_HALVU|nr:aldo/keto reductase [Halorubrum vacuolatum]SNR30859.1 2,5-diketo-D-gluconate reductase B [Halorubrum vacuolatum]
MDLPPVGLGTMGIDDPETVSLALELGYRHLDTARIYDNEAVVGEGLARSAVDRDEVTLATKLWVDDLAREDVAPAARRSAARLDVEEIDLLYVHRPYEPYDPVETIGALADLHEEGLIDAVGVSNFEPAELDAAIETLADRGLTLAAHQTELHPLWYRPELLEHARKHGYTVVAYSPLAGGEAGSVDALVDIADRHGVSPATVSLAWVRSKEPTVAIPKASSEPHLRANLAATDLTLRPEEIDAIDSIERTVELYPE